LPQQAGDLQRTGRLGQQDPAPAIRERGDILVIPRRTGAVDAHEAGAAVYPPPPNVLPCRGLHLGVDRVLEVEHDLVRATRHGHVEPFGPVTRDEQQRAR
jgi:hypothetical protein